MNIKKFLPKLLTILIFIFNNNILFSEGKPASELIHKADTTGKTGLNYILSYLYDYERFWYAVVCTMSIVILGLLLTLVIGRFLKTKGQGTGGH